MSAERMGAGIARQSLHVLQSAGGTASGKTFIVGFADSRADKIRERLAGLKKTTGKVGGLLIK